jgi:hypothetical protein
VSGRSTQGTTPELFVAEWVPSSVNSMAHVLPIRGAEAHRLLTDPRMKSVWRTLKRQSVSEDGLAKLQNWQRIESYEIGDAYSVMDRACAAFFATAVLELSSTRNIQTRKEAIKSSAPWRAAADLCWQVMRFEPRAGLDRDFAPALALVGEFFESEATLRDQKEGFYIVERSSKLRGEDRVRALARVIAAESHTIFGSFLYGTVATVVSVALKKNVTPKSIENWCKGLSQ